MRKTVIALVCTFLAVCLLLCGCKPEEPVSTDENAAEATLSADLYDDDIAQLGLLNSDNFYFVGFLTDDTSASNRMEMAVKGDSTYMGSEMEGIAVGFMRTEGQYYMVYPEGESALLIDDSVSETLGFDPEELNVDTSSLAFGEITEDMLVDTSEALVDTVTATCRTYQQPTGNIVKTYISEGHLIRVLQEDANGALLCVLDIETLIDAVPEGKVSLTSGWKVYSGSVGMMSFMMKFASAVGFDNLE